MGNTETKQKTESVKSFLFYYLRVIQCGAKRTHVFK